MIFASIVLVGAFSLSQMRLLTAGWALYALFTRVGAIDLLAVQLICTAGAYACGERFNRLTHAFGRGFSPDKVRIELYKIGRERRAGWTESVFVLAVAVVFAWLASPQTGATALQPDQSPLAWWQALLSPSDPAPPGSAVRQTSNQPASAQGRSATAATTGTANEAPAGRAPTVAARPLPTTPDIRHCLSLGNREAVVACSEKTD